MLSRQCPFGIAILAFLLSSAPASAQSLYWSDPFANRIQSGETTGTGAPTDLFDGSNNLSAPGGIALDEANGFIYLADGGTRIKRANINGTGTPITLFGPSDGLVGVSGLALDVPNDRIFWADQDATRIQVGNIDGTGSPITLYHEADSINFSQPTDIALDIANGYIYWSDWSADNIQRGNIDGSGSPAELFISTNAYGLAFDAAAGKLFWTSFTNDEILSGNADGSGSPTILYDDIDGVEVPLDIEHDSVNGRLYWTSSLDKRILGGSDDGNSPVVWLYTEEDGLDVPTYLAIIDNPPPPLPPSLVPGQRLYWSEAPMPFSGNGYIVSASLTGLGSPGDVYWNPEGDGGAMGLVADFSTGEVFWCGPSSVRAARLDGSVAPQLLFDPVEPVRGIAANFATRTLYVASGTHMLQANMDTPGSHAILFDLLERPGGVALDVANDRIYWTDLGDTNPISPAKIQVANIDGSGLPTDLFDDTDGLVEPWGIALDVGAGLIYWTDEGTSKVQVGNIDGSGSPTDLYTTADGLVGPRGLTREEISGVLYICDDAQSAIYSGSSDGSADLTALFDSSDEVFRPQYIIVNNAPAIPFSITGLPASNAWSLALTAAAIMVGAGVAFFAARLRRRKSL